MNAASPPKSTAPPKGRSTPFHSVLVRRAFRRQALIGALALGMLVFATAVLLLELRLNEGVKSRYQEALAIASQALDAHRLAAQLARERLRVQADPAAHSEAGQRDQLRSELERIRAGLLALRGLPLTPQERGRLRQLETVLDEIARPALDPAPPAVRRPPAIESALQFEQVAAVLDALSGTVAQRAFDVTARSNELDLIARYTLFIAVLLALSFGGLFALLMWRSQVSSREVMGALDRMAHEDGLTGITNRRGLDEGLAIELARTRRSGDPVTVVMLDLDHFKRFNDRRGHAAGDLLLRGAAQGWRQQMRPTDLLARYGGEEFTLVLPGCDSDTACQLIERLRPLVPERQTFSAGVATWDVHESPEQLLNRADRALLVAKKQGRNRTIVSGREPQISLPLETV
jgi:diguanylate cyclase (GGDEF)-like protein